LLLKREKFINVLIIITIVLKMKTLLKTSYWKILKLFYDNHNQPLHLREISRRIGLGEGPVSRHLNRLVSDGILIFAKDANMKKFSIKYIKEVYSMYDIFRFENLPLLRRNALKVYIKELKVKPVIVLLFGSSAVASARDESDIDIIEIFNKNVDNSKAVKNAEALTSMTINPLQMTFDQFIKELRMREDHVVQSALISGFPVYNNRNYYQVLEDERIRINEIIGKSGRSR